MKTNYFSAAAVSVLLLVATGASAQDRNSYDHDHSSQTRTTQFNDHDRQVTRDWYNQHERHAPRGFRTTDRMRYERETQIQVGQPLTRDLRRYSYSVPSDLSRQLPRAPRYHKYVAVGQNVVLMDTRDHMVRDVIDLHGGR